MSDEETESAATGEGHSGDEAGRARQPLRLARKLAFAVLVGALAFELAGNLVFLAVERRVFYLRGEPGARQEETPEPDLQPALVLHPTFGFIRRPSLPISRRAGRDRMDRLVGVGQTPDWSRLTANNYGFFAAEDYPVELPEETTVIAVFGGSVAQWFAIQGAQALVDELQRLGVATGRPMVVLNFSQGGFKQPQQLLALQYFLALGQRFDLVINLDGFNEVALSRVNFRRGVAPSMPSIQHLGPLAALLKGRSLAGPALRAVADLEGAQRVAAAQRKAVAGATTASAWLGHSALLRVAERRISEAAVAAEVAGAAGVPDDPYHVNALLDGATEVDWGPEAARMWAECSLMMSTTLGSRHVPFIQVVQPNQYVGDHRFSATERSVALNPGSPYRSGVEEGYPLLADRLQWLQNHGVAAVSAVDVFDPVEGTVYSDDCCHFNQAGNEILAGFIAHEIVARRLIPDRNEARDRGAAQSK